MDQINADLLARTQSQARAGAKVVTWSKFTRRLSPTGRQLSWTSPGNVAHEAGIYLSFPSKSPSQ